LLRHAGVNFVDLSGNVSIRAKGLVASLEGVDLAVEDAPRRSHRNPFSKKASRVARFLLASPSRAWRVRDISREGSISVGYASEVLQALVAKGYVADGSEGFRLIDPVSLLIDWSAAYRWEDNRIRSYAAAFSTRELELEAFHALDSAGARCLVTLLAAVDRFVPYVQHDQLHLYVDGFTSAAQDAVRSRLHPEPVSHGGNLHLMEPYYGDAVWYGAVRHEVVDSVSDVQLFLDLLHYPVRGAEAADVLLRKHLAPRSGLKRAQVSRLREGVGL
jgi:hypothetical protein